VPRRRARSARAVWTAAALAALVLISGLEIHRQAESHEASSCLAGHSEVRFLGACHPRQPAHAETATPARVPACAACLNRLQSVGERLGQTVHIEMDGAGHPLAIAAEMTALHRSRRTDGARAPPFA
jgi:hypothetical protein